MLVENITEQILGKEEEVCHSKKCGCSACGHDHGSTNLLVALLGGLLVLNSYLAQLFFSVPGKQFYIDAKVADWSALIGCLILAVPILYTAGRDLIQGKVYMNELVALALIAAIASGDYRTAGAVAFLMLITIMIETKTAKGAKDSIESLVRLTPRKARRIVNGKEEEADVLALQIDDICRVRPGENFPADAIIIKGTTTVNQASITGESLPADKELKDEVYAGTQNLTGLVDIKVIRVGRDTTLGKVRDLIVNAEQSKLPIMRMIDKYVGYYTPTVLMIAALVWFTTKDMNRVIAVLVISCPCALVLATPSAIIAAVASAARLGILIKNVAHLEIAARIKAVVFDKTGTLTKGNLEVAKLQPAPGIELAELLQVATSTESHSNHPAAKAMLNLAKEAEIKWEEPSKYQEVAGKGVIAHFDKDICRVGRESWMNENKLDTSHMADSLAEASDTAMSIIFVAKNNKILGWIGLSDAIRPVAKEAIAYLNRLGVKHNCMVTGDNNAVAELVAKTIQINEVKAGCLPHEKVEFVEDLKEKGYLVAVVGDGVNDAPALAAGDVGIAMGAIGSDVAIQSASVALMNNDLRRIPFFIDLSRKARSLINQNFFIGLTCIIGGLYFSTIGVITPIKAALLHSGGTLAIIFNSARLVRAGEFLEKNDTDKK